MMVETNSTTSETLAPYTTRLNTSRPIWSTPNRWDELGPVGWPKMSSAFWSAVYGPGAPTSEHTSGAKIATRITSARKVRPAKANLSSRKRRRNSSQGDRAAISPLTSSTAPTSASASSRPKSDMPTLMGYRWAPGDALRKVDLLHSPRDTTSEGRTPPNINPG